MASLYPKPRSPFWYLRYRDPKSGQMINRSTGFRRDSVAETREAKKMRAQWEAKELSVPRVQAGEEWAAWVPDFLRAKYAKSPLTLIRAQAAWDALATYFKAKGLRSARVLNRGHCISYVGWRLSEEAWQEGLRKVKHNTALLEIKFLSTVLREAVARDMLIANPALQLGLKREKAKIKPEISDEEVAKIEAALVCADEVRRPDNEAMQISWAIAMRQVCRLRETCVPLADVNLVERTITLRIKGGRDHTAMLHPELVPLFERLKATQRKTAFEWPANFAKRWFYFFRRHGLEHLSFHSTRVTGVTRLRRLGVDQRVAMEFVGHSSVLVHRIYQRQRRDDQLSAVAALARNGSCETPGDPSAT